MTMNDPRNPFQAQPGETPPFTDDDFFTVIAKAGPDGVLGAEENAALRARVEKILDARDLTPEQRASTRASLDRFLLELSTGPVWKASARTLGREWLKVVKGIEHLARGLLPLAQAQELGSNVYQLGKINALADSACALLESAAEQLLHIVDCDCGKPHETPTEPPPAEGKG